MSLLNVKTEKSTDKRLIGTSKAFRKNRLNSDFSSNRKERRSEEQHWQNFPVRNKHL